MMNTNKEQVNEQDFLINKSVDINLASLVERLKQLKDIIEQNSYVNDATKRLERLIMDAQSPPMILFLGKERVGKTTLINGLLRRELLSVNKKNSTAVNTFLRYGHQEEIKAYFNDGMVATFDLSNLEMLTTSDQFCSLILREHLEYIEVYIDHELLKRVTLIDSTSLVLGGDEAAYFSKLLISRVEEIFWVLRCGSTAIDSEILLLKKLNGKGIRPLCIVNGIEQSQSRVEDFLTTEKVNIGHLTREVIGISAENVLDDSMKWENSRYDMLIKEIEEIALNNNKTRRILEHLMNWLVRFQLDLAFIPQREPYVSALKNVEKYSDESAHILSRQQRDLTILHEYENEYLQVSNVFKSVETLYQLLQTVEQSPYLLDEFVSTFVEEAVDYQSKVRDYRKIHSEYQLELERLDARHNKAHGKGLLIKNRFGKHNQNEYLKERIHQLNEMQAECVKRYTAIKEIEGSVLNNLYTIQNHLMVLTKKRLEYIDNKVNELNLQRKRELKYLKSDVAKLNEFTCLVEAQGFIRDGIGPFFKNMDLPISDEETNQIEEMIKKICTVDLTGGGLLMNNNINLQLLDSFTSNFREKYPLHVLKLTEVDIQSIIPNVPSILDVFYE